MPQIIKKTSMDEIIKGARQKAEEAQKKFEKDGLCQSENCTEKGTLTQHGYLCEHHFQEIENLVSQLRGPGFFQVGI